jgi:hypothetical protein
VKSLGSSVEGMMGTISGRCVLHNREHCVGRCTLRKMLRQHHQVVCTVYTKETLLQNLLTKNVY